MAIRSMIEHRILAKVLVASWLLAACEGVETQFADTQDTQLPADQVGPPTDTIDASLPAPDTSADLPAPLDVLRSPDTAADVSRDLWRYDIPRPVDQTTVPDWPAPADWVRPPDLPVIFDTWDTWTWPELIVADTPVRPDLPIPSDVPMSDGLVRPDDFIVDLGDYEAWDSWTEVSPAAFSNIALDLDTEGGFSGAGSTDYHLHGGVLSIHNPYLGPGDCAAELQPQQLDALLEAAAAVHWAAVRPSYISPDNPYCCCDQFIYRFNATLTLADGGSVTVSTEWCDESLQDLPSDLLAFFDVLTAVGNEVYDGCAAPTSYTDLDLDYDTDGGFAGGGSTDFHLHDGVLTVHDPFSNPADCSAALQPEQLDTILSAAATVDWAAVQPSYVSPDNPNCCCDQIVYHVLASLTDNTGTVQTTDTQWCSESLMSGVLPSDLLDFLGVVASVGGDVQSHCSLSPP